MLDIFLSYWDELSVTAQDALLFVLLLLPTVIIGILLVRGYRPFVLLRALFWRFRLVNLLFIFLIAISLGVSVGLIAQERGLREGTARAADKFDLVITAPGNDVTMMLASVYLQPSDAPLLSGKIYQEVADHKHVAFAAPIAFGDSYEGHPVVGTTVEFIEHLAGKLKEGRYFADHGEAIAGSAVKMIIGDHFTPAHGQGEAVEEHVHSDFSYKIVGRMPPTGTPWDQALLVPVEAVWEVHGLATGHAPQQAEQLGPPFDADHFPGTPAILVRAKALWANYALRSEFTRADTMAFFPGDILSRLYKLLGDVRQLMSVMAILSQILVSVSILAGLFILMRLFAQRLALLRVLGAPKRFLFAVVWCYGALLIGIGALLGGVIAYGASAIISHMITERAHILVETSLGWPELHLVAAFISLSVVLALLPALMMGWRNLLHDLRA